MRTVLVVDDDEGFAGAVDHALEGEYRVLVARDGTQALAILRGIRANAIVLDLRMPGMDGPAFLERLRATGRQVPVIVSSAGRGLAGKARALGADEHLRKPYPLARLRAILARLLG